MNCILKPRGAVVMLLAIGLGIVGSPVARCQQGSTELLDKHDLTRVGLERVWYTQATVSPGRGTVQGTFLHIDPVKTRTLYEVRFQQNVIRYSEEDPDKFGNPLGVAGAKKEADLMAERLRLRGETAEVVEVKVPLITLFVSTTRATVDALDAETGHRYWTAQVGDPLYPTTEPAASDTRVAVCNGSDLYLINRADGKLVWKKPAKGIPAVGPVVNEDYMFVATYSGSLEAHPVAERNGAVSTYRGLSRATAQPTLTPRSVAWPTKAGHLYVAPAHYPDIRFRIESRGSMDAAAAYARGTLFVPSSDGYVYAVDEINGALRWTLSVGEPIRQKPLILGDALFLVTEELNLYKVSSLDSQVIWSAGPIRQILAATPQRLYCVGQLEQLVVLDLATGSRLYELSLPLPAIRIFNDATDRIYIATSTGMIQCLREVTADHPTIHVDLAEVAAVQKELEDAKKKPTDATKSPMGTDPFSSPMAPADPFGKPAADPFGGPGGGMPPKAADPFGTMP